MAVWTCQCRLLGWGCKSVGSSMTASSTVGCTVCRVEGFGVSSLAFMARCDFEYVSITKPQTQRPLNQNTRR